MTKRIREATVDEMANLAESLFLNGYARHKSLLMLLYHASENEAAMPLALIDALDGVSDSMLEPAMAVTVSQYFLENHDCYCVRQLRMIRLARLNLARHISNQEPPPDDTMLDPEMHQYDEAGIKKLIESVSPTNDLKAVFQAYRRLIGLKSGLLVHKTLGSDVPLEELYHAENFEHTSSYDEFLNMEKLKLS
ncbi:MAG: hypothetical protein K2X77_05805 [Candidatus Obscuribacterales bacterium]|jgi:hypothetical protein|nr:hypothetical protein [Candidatus Obscuribacterales bacterium]